MMMQEENEQHCSTTNDDKSANTKQGTHILDLTDTISAATAAKAGAILRRIFKMYDATVCRLRFVGLASNSQGCIRSNACRR